MSLQSRWAGRCRRGGRRRCLAMNEHINCPNSVGAGGLTTGGGQLCVSVPSRCNNLSTAWLLPSPIAGAGRRRRRHPVRNERINCSNYVGAGGLTTGGGQLCVSVPSLCNNLSTAWLSPSPVSGAVPQGMDVSTVLNPSVLGGSQLDVDDSVCLSPVIVKKIPLQAPPASGPELPRLSLHCPSTGNLQCPAAAGPLLSPTVYSGNTVPLSHCHPVVVRISVYRNTLPPEAYQSGPPECHYQTSYYPVHQK